ncbi:hypothetical protein MKW94_003408 [Papaver nudicaule]|uniref:DNA mismatch repair protein MutS core domain-containing protein n=1 Tax=Papaver nudicaule TaxID=74823 RepID=A0AA41S2T8_PAPNU|nr:hypothetical protein [Papaver nudicaule]
MVLKNSFNGAETGSLLHLMNHTLTTFGSRLLRHWETHPLRDRSSILSRLDAVSEIAELMGTKKDVDGFNNEEDCVEIVLPEVNHILSALQVEDDDCIGNVKEKIIVSPLWRGLILTASSSTLVGNAEQ